MALRARKSKMVKGYSKLFLRATDLDRWGHVEDAQLAYERLKDELIMALEKPIAEFNADQQMMIRDIIQCLEMRLLLLQSVHYGIGISLEDLIKIKPVLRDLMAWKGPFPILLSKNNNNITTDCGQFERVDAIPQGGVLYPQIQSTRGCHRFRIRINKIGVKNTMKLVDPTISIHVKDATAVSITSTQSTPYPKRKEKFHLHFDTDVEIQRYLEYIPNGSAIFFELKHQKPKQVKRSTKCFSFLEMEEIVPGPACIELYQSPTDFTKKKLRLLTEKPLYLHLDITIYD